MDFSFADRLDPWQVHALFALGALLIATMIANNISSVVSRFRKKTRNANRPNSNSSTEIIVVEAESTLSFILRQISQTLAVFALIVMAVLAEGSVSARFLAMVVLFAVLALKR